MNKKELVEAIAAKTAQAALPPTAVNAPVEISFESLKKGGVIGIAPALERSKYGSVRADHVLSPSLHGKSAIDGQCLSGHEGRARAA
jgi:hypothetical protein